MKIPNSFGVCFQIGDKNTPAASLHSLKTKNWKALRTAWTSEIWLWVSIALRSHTSFVTKIYYKMWQIILQNMTVILLQNATEVYYKIRQVFYYKMQQSYYKMKHYKLRQYTTTIILLVHLNSRHYIYKRNIALCL